MDKVFLIDGHAQIFRMYYAFMRHPLINSKGIDTSILYGFTKMVLELLAKEKPTHIAVAFDLHADTFRHKVYKEYKANRPPAPELVVDALEPLKEILKALNIPALGMEGYEADDVIGSMAKQWASDSCDVYMVTPDKDYGQLIDSHIYQYKFAKGSSSEPEIIDKEKICAYYGISSPESVIDILTIWGDASDNVPGVKGIGEVGAKKLIGTYGNIDNLLAHIQDLPAKQQEKIREASSHLGMSRFLVTIKTDIDLPVALDQIKVKGADASAVDIVFSKYEFTSLKKMITSFSSDAADQTPVIEDMPADDYPEDDSKPDGNYFNSYVPDQETAVEKMEIPSVRFADFAEFKGIAFQNGEVSIMVQPSGKIVLATLDKGSSRQKPAGVAWKGDTDNEVLSLLEDGTP